MSIEKAAQLYLISRNKTVDPVILSLSILKLVKGEDLDKLLESYTKILEGQVKVAKVYTASETTASNKRHIEERIKEQFKEEITFVYETDPKILGGVKVVIDDKLFDDSWLSQVEGMKI